MDTKHLQILRYLEQEMDREEARSFEARLAAEPDLQQEVNVQRLLLQAIRHSGIKNEFSIAMQKRAVARNLLRLVILAGVAVAVYLVIAAVSGKFSRSHETASGTPGSTPAGQYRIDNRFDTVIETKEGIILGIPAGAFRTAGDFTDLEITTALTPAAILQNGLSTVSNGQLLQTAGMFAVNGFEAGKPVQMVKPIAVSVPAANYNPAMQLFDGETGPDGIINWVNPVPVQRELRTTDLDLLDFYPPGYIPELKKKQVDYTNRTYTDSLYYSFSGYVYRSPSEMEADIMNIPGDEELGNEPDAFLVSAARKDTSRSGKKDSMAFPDTAVNPAQLYRHDSAAKPYYEIDPARIRALRDPAFSKTFIATEAFAERVRYMHTLCTARYLEIYLRMLDKPLYMADSACAANSTGERRKQFLAFAARKDGGVMLAEGIQGKLNRYFQQKVVAWQQAIAKTRAAYMAKLQQLNKTAGSRSAEQLNAEQQRLRTNQEEEFCINLADAYGQLGIKRSCRDTVIPPQRPYYNVTISTPGWKNLDMYVLESTDNRESMTYTDPVTGKTATLTYRELSVTVENAAAYDKVFVYLLPGNLSSFQRMQQGGSRFTEKLNMLFSYDAVAVGFRGTDMYCYRQEKMQPGAYTFTLAPLSATELNQLLSRYAAPKQSTMRAELDYRVFEQQEEIRLEQIRDEEAFRTDVAFSIFHCLLDGGLAPAEKVERYRK